MGLCRGVVLACASLLVALSWAGEGARILPGKKITKPPVIDGTISPEEWQEASLATDFSLISSGANDDTKTRAWIGYDDQFIYAAYDCPEANPADIVGRETRPGSNFEGDDYIALRLDPFDTRQDGRYSFFRVNSLGTQDDYIAGGTAAKREWRGDWDAKVGRDGHGWMVEMRIPWKVLSYPTADKPLNMTLNFVRMSQRLGAKIIWSNSTSNGRNELEGSWQGVTPPKTKFTIKPQVLAYGLVDQTDKVLSGKAGVDIKAKLSPQLNAIGALSPDFRDIEQQVESASFSRSERYQGDARPFFAEGKDFFSMGGMFSLGRLFYTRRIQEFDAGAKVFGALQPGTNIGALATIGDHTHDAGFTFAKDLKNQGQISTFGTLHHDSSRDETVYGVSGTQRFGNWALDGTGTLFHNKTQTSSASNYGVDYSVPNFFVTANYKSIPQGFRPYLSLLDYTDQTGSWVYGEYNREMENKPIRSIHMDTYVDNIDHFNGKSFLHGWNGNLNIETRNHQSFSLWSENRRYDDASDKVLGVSYGYQTTDRFRRWSTWVEKGRRSSQAYTQFGGNASVRVLKKLDLGLSAMKQNFQGLAEQYVLTAGWEFDPKRAVTGRVVKTGSDVNAYLAYRSSGFAGAELFVILGDPNAIRSQRKLVVKYVVPLK